MRCIDCCKPARFAAMLFLAISFPALAQTQAEMNAQASESYKAADTKLNQAYQSLLKRLEPAGQARLRQAQRSWIKFRDDQCAFETADTDGGSVHPMIVDICMDSLTTDRVKALEQIATCEEGNLSCPALRSQ